MKMGPGHRGRGVYAGSDGKEGPSMHLFGRININCTVRVVGLMTLFSSGRTSSRFKKLKKKPIKTAGEKDLYFPWKYFSLVL